MDDLAGRLDAVGAGLLKKKIATLERVNGFIAALIERANHSSQKIKAGHDVRSKDKPPPDDSGFDDLLDLER